MDTPPPDARGLPPARSPHNAKEMNEMSTELTQRSDDELRALADAPAKAAAELRRREREAAVTKETEARAAAEKFLLGNGRAIGSLASQLDESVARIKANPNRAEIEKANGIWAKLTDRLELAEVVARRFPGIKTPATPTVLPPGRRGLDDVADLSVKSPRRHLFPLILASDSAALRDALYRYEAHRWLIGRGASLPEDLGAVLACVVAEPDLSERIAAQRAETQRRRTAVERAVRSGR